MMGGPSGGGRTGMKKTGLLKRAGVAVMTAALMVTAVACNTKIKANLEAKARIYVKLGQYKGITVSVDEQAIENELIEKKVQNDLTSNTTYDEVSREARDKDQVTVDFTGTIGGEEVSGFSNEDYSLILGTDTFVIDGFIDALYGMSAGQTKVVILTVPEDFEDAPEYAGSRIVYNITMKKVEQPNVPMITDAYVQEYFSCNTVAEYRQSIKDDIQETIDEQIEDAKKEAVLTKLQQNCEITGYPEEYLSSKQSELETSIKFYALMQGLSNDEYCQKSFGISFEEYVKRAVAQDLIFQSIIEQEDLSITDYEYKGDLESFADKMGFTNKDSFVEKYGKDKIVRAMLLQKAQDVVMNSAVYE